MVAKPPLKAPPSEGRVARAPSVNRPIMVERPGVTKVGPAPGPFDPGHPPVPIRRAVALGPLGAAGPATRRPPAPIAASAPPQRRPAGTTDIAVGVAVAEPGVDAEPTSGPAGPAPCVGRKGLDAKGPAAPRPAPAPVGLEARPGLMGPFEGAVAAAIRVAEGPVSPGALGGVAGPAEVVSVAALLAP